MLVTVLAALGTWPSSGQTLGLQEDRVLVIFRRALWGFQASICEAPPCPPPIQLPSQSNLQELWTDLDGVADT